MERRYAAVITYTTVADFEWDVNRRITEGWKLEGWNVLDSNIVAVWSKSEECI